MTAPYITKLVHDGVLPREKHGWYRMVECNHAFIKYREEIIARANQSTSADKLRDERAQEIRIKTAARERELIPLADALADGEEKAGLYLTSISGLPARITRNPRERQRIEAICDEERLRLSDRFAKQAKVLETGISLILKPSPRTTPDQWARKNRVYPPRPAFPVRENLS